MFIFMGLFLDKSGVARELMENMARLLGRVRGGLAISVGDLFMGAMIPGLMLGLIYVVFILIWARLRPDVAPPAADAAPMTLRDVSRVVLAMLPPIFLIFAALGGIFFGVASPTEASGVGAVSTVILAAFKGRLSLQILKEVSLETMRTTGFIFAVVFGATAFSLVLRGLGGDELINDVLHSAPISPNGVLIVGLLVTFVPGFFLDWLEITLIILPLVGPAIGGLGFDLVWFAILFAICLQTSFITPPVGPALFYAQGMAPPGVTLIDIYRGIIPFVMLHPPALAVVLWAPALATWLPSIAC